MPREERRSADRPTRRREPAIRPDAARSQLLDEGDTPSGHGGPFRRHDDPRDSADDRIRELLLEQLDRNGEIDASEIEVLVEAGEVTLQGTVADHDMRRLTEGVAESVAGVSLVHNRLRLARA